MSGTSPDNDRDAKSQTGEAAKAAPVEGKPVEIRWAPKMKTPARAPAPASLQGSANVANKTIGFFRIMEVRRQKGQAVDETYIEKIARTLDPEGAKKRAERAPGPKPKTGSPWPVGLAIVALLGAAAFVYAAAGGSGHRMSGTLFFMGRRLDGVTLVFHPAAGAATHEVTTDDKANFKIEGLPPGTYRVTIDLTGVKVVIPPPYTKPESTPFVIPIFKDVENVRLIATPHRPKPRPAATRHSDD